MTVRQAHHAQRVVEAFKQKLSQSGIDHVGDQHFKELELLIESALSAVMVDELEKVADKADKFAGELRDNAENFRD